jgi:hypothetical protein
LSFFFSLCLFIFLCITSFLGTSFPGAEEKSTSFPGAEEKLLHLDTRTLNIDHLDVRVEEVKREESISTVTIKRSKGPSGEESLFVIRALCLIAESRDMRYFIILSEGDDKNGKYTYSVGYLKEQIQNLNGHFGITADRPVTDQALMDSKDLMMMFGW